MSVLLQARDALLKGCNVKEMLFLLNFEFCESYNKDEQGGVSSVETFSAGGKVFCPNECRGESDSPK